MTSFLPEVAEARADRGAAVRSTADVKAPELVDCAGPAADATVTEVHRGADAEYPRPVGASEGFTLKTRGEHGIGGLLRPSLRTPCEMCGKRAGSG